MENQELFKQAILDAKAVRETAMAAARTTLAEHFEPFIKETMAKELTKEEHDTMEEDNEMEEAMKHHKKHDATEMEEAMKHHKKHDATEMEEAMKHHKKHDATEMEESTLDEILAELDALSEENIEEGDHTVDEGHVPEDGYVGKAGRGATGYNERAGVSHGDGKLHEADDEKEEEDDEAEEAGEDLTKDIEAARGGEEQEVVDITVGELKDIIRDVFMQLQGGDMAPGASLDGGTELATDLGSGGEMEAGEEEISLDEILAELEEEEHKMEEVKKKHHHNDKVDEGTGPGGEIDPKAESTYKVEEIKKELNEAVKTIKALKTELNEINLFSAKLLYVNKIFKAKNLSESQKTKVINAFDRTTTIKEVENTYKTLLESISVEAKKTSLKESVGFASKPIGSAPARPIVEADAFVSRWQQLAGIKK